MVLTAEQVQPYLSVSGNSVPGCSCVAVSQALRWRSFERTAGHLMVDISILLNIRIMLNISLVQLKLTCLNDKH